MKPIKPDQMTVDQLVERFIKLALEQDDALLGDDIAKVNHLFDQLEIIEAELKRRPGDQRRALLRLYDHSNPQVRVKAIKATLAVTPKMARDALQMLASSGEYPQAGEAGMSIRALDRGIYKPV